MRSLISADLGAGEGGLLLAALQAAPQASGILFDQPRVVENARRLLADRLCRVASNLSQVIYSMRCRGAPTSIFSNKSCMIGVTNSAKNPSNLPKCDVAWFSTANLSVPANSGHCSDIAECPLMTQSGHWREFHLREIEGLFDPSGHLQARLRSYRFNAARLLVSAQG
jgi:hypothetical protein